MDLLEQKRFVKRLINYHAIALFLLFVGSAIISGNPLSLILSLIAYPVALGMALALQGLFTLITHKRVLKKSVLALLYFSPISLFLLLNQLVPDPPNQKSPSQSPSGHYVIEMRSRQAHWIVRIRDHEGKPLYEDTDSNFLGRFNVYWGWDQEDRLWLYNSDDSRIFYWQATPRGWVKREWVKEEQKPGSKLKPPQEMLPDYAKEHPDPSPPANPQAG